MPIESESDLSCIEINPRGDAKYSVIWLHGLGADGSDFVPMVNELQLPSSLGIRFVFPSAPIMPITINNGYEMRAWYDIRSNNLHDQMDLDGIRSSVKNVHQLINTETTNGRLPENIILAGFSQGGAIALTTALGFPQKLGGVITLSSYLPNMGEVLKSAQVINKETPIFIAHGMEDVLVPYALGKTTYIALKQAGYPLTWHSYPMEHSVCHEEVVDIAGWLQGICK